MDQPASSLGQQPFRFLDLPKELRLMIYERLIVRPSIDLHFDLATHMTECVRDATIRIVTPGLAAPITLVCKTLHAEAAPMLTKSRSTLRVIFDFKEVDGVLRLCLLHGMRAFAGLLSAVRASDSMFRHYYVGLMLWTDLRKIPNCRGVLEAMWSCLRTGSLEIALRGQHGPLSSDLVSHFLYGMDMKGLSGGFDVAVYEAPQMRAGADGAAAVHEAALHDKVLDEKTWNEKWV